MLYGYRTACVSNNCRCFAVDVAVNALLLRLLRMTYDTAVQHVVSSTQVTASRLSVRGIEANDCTSCLLLVLLLLLCCVTGIDSRF